MTEHQFKEVTEWQKVTFPTANALSKIHHLEQEVLEIKLDLVENNPERRLEFADCFLLLFDAASADGMSYQDCVNCIQEKFEIVKKRKWGEPDANGVVNHIKE